jgi:L-threonylcarbamoyladenylate synthase
MVDFEGDIKRCVDVLQQGGVIVYPTDTVWGIGCDATNEAAVEKVFALKQRPSQKSMIVLLADARDILQYVAAPPPDIIALAEAFETPTTVIYDHALGLAENAIAEDGSIGIRVTDDAFCKALIKRFRKPIISTSANISGAPTPAIYAQIENALIAGADYVVQHRQDDEEPRASSRIARMDDEGNLTFLR